MDLKNTNLEAPMFTLMQQPGTQPPAERPQPPSTPPAPAASAPAPAGAEAQADWPADVHLPDPDEDDEC